MSFKESIVVPIKLHTNVKLPAQHKNRQTGGKRVVRFRDMFTRDATSRAAITNPSHWIQSENKEQTGTPIPTLTASENAKIMSKQRRRRTSGVLDVPAAPPVLSTMKQRLLAAGEISLDRRNFGAIVNRISPWFPIEKHYMLQRIFQSLALHVPNALSFNAQTFEIKVHDVLVPGSNLIDILSFLLADPMRDDTDYFPSNYAINDPEIFTDFLTAAEREDWLHRFSIPKGAYHFYYLLSQGLTTSVRGQFPFINGENIRKLEIFQQMFMTPPDQRPDSLLDPLENMTPRNIPAPVSHPPNIRDLYDVGQAQRIPTAWPPAFHGVSALSQPTPADQNQPVQIPIYSNVERFRNLPTIPPRLPRNNVSDDFAATPTSPGDYINVPLPPPSFDTPNPFVSRRDQFRQSTPTDDSDFDDFDDDDDDDDPDYIPSPILDDDTEDSDFTIRQRLSRSQNDDLIVTDPNLTMAERLEQSLARRDARMEEDSNQTIPKRRYPTPEEAMRRARETVMDLLKAQAQDEADTDQTVPKRLMSRRQQMDTDSEEEEEERRQRPKRNVKPPQRLQYKRRSQNGSN